MGAELKLCVGQAVGDVYRALGAHASSREFFITDTPFNIKRPVRHVLPTRPHVLVHDHRVSGLELRMLGPNILLRAEHMSWAVRPSPPVLLMHARARSCTQPPTESLRRVSQRNPREFARVRFSGPQRRREL